MDEIYGKDEGHRRPVATETDYYQRMRDERKDEFAPSYDEQPVRNSYTNSYIRKFFFKHALFSSQYQPSNIIKRTQINTVGTVTVKEAHNKTTASGATNCINPSAISVKFSYLLL